MTARAYAKINFGLRILGRRPDGYHDLETVFHQINLYDELEFRLHENTVILSTSLKELPSGESNLCVRAAQLLRDLTGTRDGAEITLRKNIPLGAGLGGGSADAAATLLGLTNLWNLDVSVSELHSLALSIGSDVPFFLTGGTAYATGRGELLEPLAVNLPYWIIVVTPPIHVSTAWAYKSLQGREFGERKDLRRVLMTHMHEPETLARELVNDFEESVFASHPEIMRIKERMLELGADCALMSGSGASVFSLARSEATAKKLIDELSPLGRVSSSPPFFSPRREDLTNEKDGR